MPLLDVFNNDAFSVKSLTDAIVKAPFKPSRVGALGLFGDRGITTTSLVVEEKDGILALLSTAPRGSTGTVGRAAKRRVRSLAIPHIPHDDAVLAEEVQNVRAFGSENAVQAVGEIVAQKLVQMRLNHEVTLEHLRIGALQGIILDADGLTVIYNLFTEFGVTEVEIDFALDDSDTDVRLKCISTTRAVEDALGAMMFGGLHALCGADFFEAFISHTYVKDAYHRFQDSANLRNDPRKGFLFGGIMFEEYRGQVGDIQFLDSETARFFPLGTSQLFTTYYAPADFMETVNTVGLPIYAKQERMKFDKGVELHTQSNPLPLCLRPKCLIKGVISGEAS